MNANVKKEANDLLIKLGHKSTGHFTKSDEKKLRSVLGGVVDLQQNLDDEVIRRMAEYKGVNSPEFFSRVRGSNLQVNAVDSLFKSVSLDFLDEFKEDVNWDNPDLYRDFANQKPSQSINPYSNFRMSRFLFRFKDHINWENLLRYYRMPENEIMFFEDYVNWGTVSEFLMLSEEFMQEYSEFLNWEALCKNQKMSDDFILRMNKKINFNILVRYQKLSMNILNTFLSRMSMNDICQFQWLDDYFLVGHAETINWSIVHNSRIFSISAFVKEQCAEHIKDYIQEPFFYQPKRFPMNEVVRKPSSKEELRREQS
jgi:DNA polymerase III alpha subunit